MTYQSQVLAFGGAPARQAVYALLALDGVDCRNLNRNCYGLVEVSGGVGTLNLASKDQNGAVVVDPTTLGACALSQGSPEGASSHFSGVTPVSEPFVTLAANRLPS